MRQFVARRGQRASRKQKKLSTRNASATTRRRLASSSSSSSSSSTSSSSVASRLRGPGLDGIEGFAALRALDSNGGDSHAVELMEVHEWVGDAVIGELVARCLLSQFHRAPLAARVFRNLRLGAVTNQNLAAVFDKVGYQRRSTSRPRRLKEKADIVEAVVGEIVIRLELQKRDVRACGQLRGHLDEILSNMLHEHFGERRRVHQKAALAGPLTVSFNAFGCLPLETLDEETGELVIREGSVDMLYEQIAIDSDPHYSNKSFVDLVDECEYDDKRKASLGFACEGPALAFHAYDQVSDLPGRLDLRPHNHDDAMQAIVTSICRRVHAVIRQVDSEHVLRSSQEIFNVFKIYGMTVLSERVSLSLAFPQLSARLPGAKQRSQSLSPSLLTTQRQAVLSMSNLAEVAIVLGLRKDHVMDDFSHYSRRLLANSLRAAVGFYSAVAAGTEMTSLADDVSFLLCHFAARDDVASRCMYPPVTPKREPLSSLSCSLIEACEFMNSQVCDDLHQVGERPRPTPAPALLLRKCDSNTVENLFKTLDKQRHKLTERATAEQGIGSSRQVQRKRKRNVDNADESFQHRKPSANLSRFVHRRFLYCLEELVVLFAQRKTEECRKMMALFELDLEPCAGDLFRKWEVSTSTLTLAMRDSFYRLLLHDLCGYHCLVSTSKNTRDGTRITQLRLPLHYTWPKVSRRVTTKEEACS